MKRNKFHVNVTCAMSCFRHHLVFISVQLQAKYIPNMAKNSAAQYEVAAVDDEDGVKWPRWWGGSMAAAAFHCIED